MQTLYSLIIIITGLWMLMLLVYKALGLQHRRRHGAYELLGALLFIFSVGGFFFSVFHKLFFEG